MNQPIVGIDPGAQGALCVLGVEINSPFFYPLADLDIWHFLQIVKDFKPSHIFLEKAQSMPRQGIASTFKYGVGFGKLQGWIEAADTPFTMVTPAHWTKEMHRGVTGTDAKGKSSTAVQRLFPSLNIKALSSLKPVRQGMIDALLIAEYGRRILK